MLLAHKEKDSDNITQKEQSLEEHLKNVSMEMEQDLNPVSFPCLFGELNTTESLKRILQKTGAFHDIGKSSKWFQEYLETSIETRCKDHSLISGIIFSEDYDIGDILGFLSTVAIIKHHGNLLLDKPNYLNDILEKQYKNIKEQTKRK
ncbi:hypothetical protein P261_00085 [Lachnospiraceae bacterium TWA4]|nr:hypothetical protein P261_00085 [Lachnospiraceae bacterium TWA4]